MPTNDHEPLNQTRQKLKVVENEKDVVAGGEFVTLADINWNSMFEHKQKEKLDHSSSKMKMSCKTNQNPLLALPRKETF
jgi:hypothetical protein